MPQRASLSAGGGARPVARLRVAAAADLCLAAIIAVGCGAICPAVAQERITRPGQYSGYSPVLYDGFAMSSQYVVVRDGTRIAVDVFRPTKGGVPASEKLPVVWMNTPYNRRQAGSNPGARDSASAAASYPGAALELVKYGYVVAVADMRGNYASFGKAVHTNRNQWMPWAYWDAYDVTEWLAAQSWSDGGVGMWGCSATGHSQWQAAATRPPHLKAIFPLSAPSEYYDWGGITATYAAPPALAPYPGAVPAQDAAAAPVDADIDGALLNAAKDEHRGNLEPGYMPFRDSVSPDLAARLGWKNFRYWLEVNTFAHLRDINRSAIPAYQSFNFGEDLRAKQGVAIKLRNLTNPMKTLFAPGNHCNWSTPQTPNALNRFDIVAEELRWFDHWLKGVDNGVMSEPPIYYYTYNAPADRAWRFAWQWPLPNQKSVTYYFAPAGEGGAGGGRNNGSLTTAQPIGSGAKDDYTVDYGVTAANQNERGLTYTTPVLAADTTVVGHPIVRLWVSSTATDGDFLAYLADVAPDGSSKLLPGTDDGRLRASHRALGKPPYDNAGLPYHRSFEQDVRPLKAGDAAELVFDLAPVSYVFKAGHRIRLIVTMAATPRRGEAPPTPVLSPSPVVSVHRDPVSASSISLPLSETLSPALRIVRGRSETTMRITFPETMDRRYLSDLKPGSVLVGGAPARSVKVVGRTIVAQIGAGAESPAAPLTVSGSFGGRYDYGGEMRFSVTESARSP